MCFDCLYIYFKNEIDYLTSNLNSLYQCKNKMFKYMYSIIGYIDEIKILEN